MSASVAQRLLGFGRTQIILGVTATKFLSQVTLPAGTWAYKYRVVPNAEQCVGRCDDSDWEDVPEECGVAWGGAGGGGSAEEGCDPAGRRPRCRKTSAS